MDSMQGLRLLVCVLRAQTNLVDVYAPNADEFDDLNGGRRITLPATAPLMVKRRKATADHMAAWLVLADWLEEQGHQERADAARRVLLARTESQFSAAFDTALGLTYYSTPFNRGYYRVIQVRFPGLELRIENMLGEDTDFVLLRELEDYLNA